ncbi:hypothetical protein C8A01DRAFT_40058 [Parachaetomium inaequale]|uniref:Uncharacterized protein n=1 Tax=Parachaetomium inaequale TaxID=2588326 RepID=A0AAN6P886_9PEZI|nr:hypothetical protein C8A01DRAFT_40058 [Parachaetomium inaequale]
MLDHVTVFKHWSDFNFPAIALAFGDILDQDIKALRSDYERVRSLSGTPTMIGRKGELDDLAFSWTYQVLRHPVKGAAAILRPRTSARGRDTTPEEAISDDSEPLETQYRHNHPSERKKSLAYLVGTSRLKELWKSEWLKRDPCDLRVVAEPPPEWPVPFSLTKPHLDVQDTRLLPLREVATYCRFAQTRYGYILTQSEFVALRVRRIPPPSNETKPHAAVEYVSVPWEAETGLTTTLAMWALACMAMNDEQREMEMVDGKPLRAMARLTWWTYDETEKVYENVISKRRIPAVEWRQAEYGAFVQLMEEEGNSHTKNFVPPKEPRGPKRDAKTRRHYVIVNGTARDVEML